MRKTCPASILKIYSWVDRKWRNENMIFSFLAQIRMLGWFTLLPLPLNIPPPKVHPQKIKIKELVCLKIRLCAQCTSTVTPEILTSSEIWKEFEFKYLYGQFGICRVSSTKVFHFFFWKIALLRYFSTWLDVKIILNTTIKYIVFYLGVLQINVKIKRLSKDIWSSI